ncbi:hypothetical protein [Kitasatospora sp. GP82]|uniref:hypothetical protein n=1 Tax=Kitasatospora sp. GP82 TaxID=3035089 RepID=UPI002475F083|nr:hypothetical protein [Kitasatospora sp. GP82]MDH6123873.1 hypothetical protein [Kitasatospora sp. GP82]
MAHRQQEHSGATPRLRGAPWQPPEEEVRRVYQPVEVHHQDGTWAVGRINAWWHPAGGQPWCRVRTIGSGEAPKWMPFDPEQLVLLPVTGT